jgi:hypothetical protein
VRKNHRAVKTATTKHDRFWVRKPNAELDRSGDWLLKNLSVVRAQAVSRADPR